MIKKLTAEHFMKAHVYKLVELTGTSTKSVEDAPKVRARVCHGLEFLGLKLDETLNGSSPRPSHLRAAPSRCA